AAGERSRTKRIHVAGIDAATAAARLARCAEGRRELPGAVLGDRLEARETGLQVAAHPLFPVDDPTHDPRQQREWPLHLPGHARAADVGRERERRAVATRERLDELQVDRDTCAWRRLGDLHPAFADVAVALPFVRCADAALGAAVPLRHL